MKVMAGFCVFVGMIAFVLGSPVLAGWLFAVALLPLVVATRRELR